MNVAGLRKALKRGRQGSEVQRLLEARGNALGGVAVQRNAQCFMNAQNHEGEAEGRNEGAEGVMSLRLPLMAESIRRRLGAK